jgi:hypothetical protein
MRIISVRKSGDLLYFNHILSRIFFFVSLDGVSGAETRLLAGRSEFWNPARAKDFSLQNVQTGSRAHPFSCSSGTRVITRKYNGRGVKFISQLHPMPRSRMSGAMPLLLLFAYMVWTRTALPYTSFYCAWRFTPIPILTLYLQWFVKPVPV